MKLIFFIVSLLLFLTYLTGEEGGEEKRKKRKNNNLPISAHIPQEREEEAYSYYKRRLETLRPLLREAIEEENKAREKLLQIEELNNYGAIVNDKNVKKAQREVYQTTQRRLTIEQQIFTATRGKNKARGA